MVERIPQLDPTLSKEPSSVEKIAERENLEFDLLKAEAKLIKLSHRETWQRYMIKWAAVITGLVVIAAMGFVLWHLVHSVFWGPFMRGSAAFSVVIVTAPIVSITTITVALFVGAFRRFEDKDLETMGNGVAGAANLIRG